MDNDGQIYCYYCGRWTNPPERITTNRALRCMRCETPFDPHFAVAELYAKVDQLVGTVQEIETNLREFIQRGKERHANAPA